jgi:pimeloyl-ACP methyl ester carboxylesterase
VQPSDQPAQAPAPTSKEKRRHERLHPRHRPHSVRRARGINSYILQQFLPDAELIIYPDANHGAHFQYPERFVTHTRLFLDR